MKYSRMRRGPFSRGRRIKAASAVAGVAVLLAAGVAVLLAAGAAGAAGSSNPPIGVTGTKPVYATVGPDGQKPVSATTVRLTGAEMAAIKKGHYSVAMSWTAPATFISAVTAGVKAELARLHVRVAATAIGNNTAPTQVNQLQTIGIKHPNAVISLPLDATTEASAYRALAKRGSKLIFLSDVAAGLKYPSQYQGMVTDDLANMGKDAAILLGKAMHGHGNAAMVYYSASYYVTNERDAAFRTWLHKLYPGINLVAQEGFADPTTVQSVATAMMQRHPNINGIYVSWSTPPADELIAGLRSLGTSTSVKVVTDDLDPAIDAGLVNGQYMAGVVADQPYLLGETLAKEAALAIIGKRVPSFAIVKAIPVTKSNLLATWKATLDQKPPKAITSAFH